jgi:hypothetical protein
MTIQPTVRAREILARIEEIDGNKAGAFTLRTEGAVGSVFEAKLAVVLEALTPQTSEEVVEAVARAIAASFEQGSPDLAKNMRMDWQTWAPEARAAIAAMPSIPQDRWRDIGDGLNGR